MDRQIVYPGSIPLDTDLLSTERNVMAAIGYLAQAVLGTGVVADGLACAPTAPPSMTVMVGPGSITQFGALDTTAFGSLPPEPGTPLVRMGINLAASSFTLTAPGGSGQAINYLIEASFLEADATPLVLPYYNAANPGQPYSGPGNDGAAQNTQRLQSVQLQVKAGAPGALGSQATPPVDAGWVGLYIVTVTSGQTAIGPGNIAQLPSAPFLAWKLPQMTPGTRNLAVFTPASQGNWSVPPGVSAVKLRVWGGGGSGGAGLGGAGGGGGGGGYSEGFYSVSAGQVYAVTVGNGGVGSASAGGPSGFGNLATAGGGGAGGNGSSTVQGAGASAGGNATGSGLIIPGGAGGGAFSAAGALVGGQGGAAFGGGGAASVVGPGSGAIDGHAGTAPGGGGGGGIGNGAGGQGGAGLVLIEW